jgi:hypothetical protein
LTLTPPPVSNALPGDIFIAWEITLYNNVSYSTFPVQPMPPASFVLSNWSSKSPLWWTASQIVYNATNGGFRFGPPIQQTWNTSSLLFTNLTKSWTLINAGLTNIVAVTNGQWSVSGYGVTNRNYTINAGPSLATLTNVVATIAGTNGPWIYYDTNFNSLFMFYAVICRD